MKVAKINISWQAMLSIALVLSSALLYFLHYKIFNDFHHIGVYLVGDIAFVPLEVLLVTIVLHRLLDHNSKKEKLNKLNMVIGAFFSEVGSTVLKELMKSVHNQESISKLLCISATWSDKTFKAAATDLRGVDPQCDVSREELQQLKESFVAHRTFLLALLENGNLLEHETFADMLWALFHLVEELSQRDDLSKISDEDLKHLTIDIKRAYQLLTIEWLAYMKHLKSDYPYLFSFALRTSPFDKSAKLEF